MKDIAPKCVCGHPCRLDVDGIVWVCNNSECEGYRQVGGYVTAVQHRKLAEYHSRLADPHHQPRAD